MMSENPSTVTNTDSTVTGNKAEASHSDERESNVDNVTENNQSCDVLPASVDIQEKADKIVRKHVLCSMGAGLIPIPLVDVASVTAIQVDALKGLAELHGVDYSEGNARAIVTGLAGSTLARLGASAVKLVPGVGSVAGGLTMAGLSGASTYAICQVAQNHFKTKGTFLDFNTTDAKEAYATALEKGKELVKTLEEKKDQAIAKFEEIQQLEKEKATGNLSNEEYAKRQEDIISKDDSEKPS